MDVKWSRGVPTVSHLTVSHSTVSRHAIYLPWYLIKIVSQRLTQTWTLEYVVVINYRVKNIHPLLWFSGYLVYFCLRLLYLISTKVEMSLLWVFYWKIYKNAFKRDFSDLVTIFANFIIWYLFQVAQCLCLIPFIQQVLDSVYQGRCSHRKTHFHS